VLRAILRAQHNVRALNWSTLAGAFRRIESELLTMTDIPTIFDTTEAARFLGLAQSTLAKLRLSGRGPIFCKLGRRVLYRQADLDDYLSSCRRRSTAAEVTP
jgi:Helix-turn-helix domain